MKKKLLIVLIIIFLSTGCSCEYNLIIDDNEYKEQTTLISTDSQEIANFNRKWEIAVDKDEYYIGVDEESDMTPNGKSYEYTVDSNKLTFKNNYNKSEYSNSTAASICYSRLSVTDYSQSTVISTNSKVNCFDKYPTLTSVNINITVDRPVTSNNADSINGNTYTWILTKDNANNKAINLVLDNSIPEESKKDTNETGNNQNNDNNQKNNDYTMYIFSGILLIVLLIGYGIYKKVTNKDDSMSD